MTTRHVRPSHCVMAVAVTAAVMSATAYAQVPGKPIRLVAGFSAGGSIDQVARLIGPKMSAGLGNSVVVDNRPGAGGNIACEIVQNSPPDGNTLLIAPAAFSVNPSLFNKVNYDPIKGFEPVTRLVDYMLFLVAHPSIPARNIKDLIAMAKARPDQVNFSSAGTGTTTHIAGELLSYLAGIKMQHIAYKGTGPQLPAVLGGEVALAFGSTTVVPFIQSGKLALLGVTGAKRFPAFPNTPTIGETVKGFEVTGWQGMWAPAGTPPNVIKRINEEVVKALKDPDVLKAFAAQGLDAEPSTPQELGNLVKVEVAKWAKVIEFAKIPKQ